MLFIFSTLVAFGILLPSATLSQDLDPHHQSRQLQVSKVFQFGQSGIPIENLAVRSNGNLVFTLQGPKAGVYEGNPSAGNSSFRLVANFNQLGRGHFSSGIHKIQRDIFAVAAGNENQTGTAAIYTLDFRSGKNPVVIRTNQVNEARLLNGMEVLDGAKGQILMSDSYNGVVYRIDTKSGQHDIALDDDSLKAVPGSTGIPAIGVNGIRRRGNYLYYTNTGKSTFSRVLIDGNGKARGKFELVTSLKDVQERPDDFAISSTGEAFITGTNVLTRVARDGSVRIVAGGANDTSVQGVTSAYFGRSGNRGTLFVSAGVAPAPYGYIAAVKGIF